MAKGKKTEKEKDIYVLKKTHDTKTGVMTHRIERKKDGVVANFITGKTDNTVIHVDVKGDKVTYANGMIANSVTLKSGITVSYGTDANGDATVLVNKGEVDITNTAAGKEAARDALKAIFEADSVIAGISRSRDAWKNLYNFQGLYSWAKKAQQHLEARLKIHEARKKLGKEKVYANAEIATNSGATPEQVARQQAKDSAVAGQKAEAAEKQRLAQKKAVREQQFRDAGLRD